MTNATLLKAPTGIHGFDDLTEGGLPRGRAALVCGDPGCGKTLFGLEFLVRGAQQYDEPGVFVSFEETPQELATNSSSLDFRVPELVEANRLAIEHIMVEPGALAATGEYDLEGLFVRIGAAIDAVQAKRVVLDTLEALFGGLDANIVRAELRRLLSWLKDKGLTVVITGERVDRTLTRHGIEAFVSDCVIVLDHRVEGETSTRRLRVLKYRGSKHATNEYPFLIDDDGFSVLPITSLRLQHKTSTERQGTGLKRLDEMLGGKGFYVGSSILVSGSAGTGKTSFAGHLANAVCAAGKRCLYLSHEESPSQLLRNFHAIGLDHEPYIKKGLLRMQGWRPFQYGMEMHLVLTHKLVAQFKPDTVIVDPISNYISNSNFSGARSMLTRLIDFLKMEGVTTCFTALSESALTQTDITGVSSLIDTWLQLQMVESNGERNRLISIVKSRGMPHSNQNGEFVITSKGVQIRDVYVGPNGALTGSARSVQEATEAQALRQREDDIEKKRLLIRRRREALEAQVASLRATQAAEEAELQREVDKAVHNEVRVRAERADLASERWAFATQSEETPAEGKMQ